jgi:hypothetical protein
MERPVTVRLSAQWGSGSATVNVLIDFEAPDLDTALRLIQQAAPTGAPLFAPSLEEVAPHVYAR